MKKALAVINRNAGQSRNDSLEEQLIHKLNDENYEVMIKETPETGAGTLVSKHTANKDLIVIAGGDGTISEVIDALLQEQLEIPIAIIPSGTVNDVARVHDIPLDTKKAVDRLDTFKKVPVDAIRMNDRHASYLIALGSFMTAFAEVGSGIKNKIGRIAYLGTGIRMLLQLKTYKVEIKTPDQEFESDSVFTIVSKLRSVGSVGRLIKKAGPDDGLLHIINIKPVNPLEAVHLISLAVAGNITAHKKVSYTTAESVRIKAIGLDHMNVDGDMYDYEDLEISVLKDAVHLMKPVK